MYVYMSVFFFSYFRCLRSYLHHQVISCELHELVVGLVHVHSVFLHDGELRLHVLHRVVLRVFPPSSAVVLGAGGKLSCTGLSIFPTLTSHLNSIKQETTQKLEDHRKTTAVSFLLYNF